MSLAKKLIVGTFGVVALYLVLVNEQGATADLKATDSLYTGAVGALQGNGGPAPAKVG